MIGICKLCGQHKKLCKSHILPKSFTKRMREGSAQVLQVTVKEVPKVIKSNGDHATHLLCENCEALLKNNYEDYGTRLFVNKKNFLDTDNAVYILNFEYEKYFMFVLSILWRASVSSLNIYRQMEPFAAFDDVIKPCIFNNELKISSEYSLKLDDFIKISILRIVDETKNIPQVMLDKIIMGINFEQGNSVESGLCYYFMVDGFLVTVTLFAIDSAVLKKFMPKGRLQNRGFLKIPKVSFSNIKQLQEGISAIVSSENPFNPD